MNEYNRIVKLIALTPILVILFLAPSAVPAAHAYGSTHVWEFTFSSNCNDPAICGPTPGTPGTGGFWGWCELDSSIGSISNGDGGDCQVTGYGRTSLGVAVAPSHASVSITAWNTTLAPISPGVMAPFVNLISGSVTTTGPGIPFPVSFPSGPIFPAIDTHFSSHVCFGFTPTTTPPGCHFNFNGILLP